MVDASRSRRQATVPLVMVAAPSVEDLSPALVRLAAFVSSLELEIVVLRVLERTLPELADGDPELQRSQSIAHTVDLCDRIFQRAVDRYRVIAREGDFGQVTTDVARMLAACLIIIPSGAPRAEATARLVASETGAAVLVAAPAPQATTDRRTGAPSARLRVVSTSDDVDARRRDG